MLRRLGWLVLVPVGLGTASLHAQDTTTVDHGACPGTDFAEVAAHQHRPRGLERHSGPPVIFAPIEYTAAGLLGRGRSGYLVLVGYHQTRGAPQTSGSQLAGVLFRGDSVVDVFTSANLNRHRMLRKGLNYPHRVGPIPRDDREWTAGNTVTQRRTELIEFVPSGDSLPNWTELVTMQTFPSANFNVELESLIENIARAHRESCEVVEQRIISTTRGELLYAQVTRGCREFPDEWSIRKLIRGPQMTTEVSYARRSALDGDDEAKWTAIVARAQWLGDCEPR